MRAFEVWNDLSPALNHEILETAYRLQKKLYRRVIDDLAPQLRMRPQRLLDMPKVERHALFQPLLALPLMDVLSQNLLLHWLAQEAHPLMATFLNELGIAHDGKGCVEEFPATVDPARLAKAVETLYASFPAEKVTLYLRTFDSVSGCQWPGLTDLVQNPATP
jgi:hypothetical protein